MWRERWTRWGKPDRLVEDAGEQSLQAFPVAAARRLLALHVEQLPLDGFDDQRPVIEIRPEEGDVIREGAGIEAVGFSGLERRK